MRRARFAAAIVFGSVARGRSRPDSELDLAVLYADPAARRSAEREWLTLTGRLALAAGCDVHLVDLEAADAGLRRTMRDSPVAIARIERPDPPSQPPSRDSVCARVGIGATAP